MKRKKIEIMGVEIDNYSVRESLLLADAYLNNNVMNTIEYITMDTVNKAAKDSHLKNQLEKIDLLMPCEKEMLDVYGIKDIQRRKEIGDNIFFVEFLRKAIRLNKKVFILGEKGSTVSNLKEFLTQFYEELQLVGSVTLESGGKDIQGLVNTMNAEAPDIIFSILPSPQQEDFLEEQNDKISAKVWFGFGNSFRKRNGLLHAMDELLHLLKKLLLRARITKYQNER